MIKKAVFPVAGLGTRFLPATKAVPKELLPVLDKPLLQYAVEEARAAGVEEFIFVTSAEKPSIENHFQHCRLSNIKKELEQVNIAPEKLHIVYQDEPRGLGHAVLCAKDVVGDEPFAVLLPDDMILSTIPCLQQMVELWNKQAGPVIAAMNVPRADVSKYGIIKGKNTGRHINVEMMVEKPSADHAPSTTAVIGRYILPAETFALLQKVADAHDGRGEIQLTTALDQLAENGNVTGFRFEGERYDCGHLNGWLAANIAFGLDRADTRDDLMALMQNIINDKNRKIA